MHRGISGMKVAVLGDGILGSEFVKQTGWDYFSRKKDGFDITNHLSFNMLIDWSDDRYAGSAKYDTIINCIANTDTYSKDQEKHWQVNYQAVASLVDFCNVWNIKLVHISTDHIYTNSKNQASESNVPVHMETWYGYTKLLGDAHVQLKSNNYLVIRESHKPYPFPYKSAWEDQYTNGDYVNVIAGLIIKLIEKQATGVFNVGTEEKTWYEYTREEFGTTPGTKLPAAPYNITMDLTKLKNELKDADK
jgi:dTDP-4-dehydrorhamnose reductase